MDALKSGAIFRLKNMAVVRSPPAVSISKPDDPVVAKVTVDESRNAGPTTLSDEASVIKRRFDEIYRSTPTPAAMLNRSYHWDQGNNLSAPGSSQTKLDNPSSSSSAQLSGIYYQPYRPPPSMQYYDQSIQFQHRSAYRSATMPPPMLPPSSIQSHQSIDSPTQDIQDSSPQPKISPIRSYSEIDSIDRNSGSKGRLKSRGRLGGPNTLMNLTMSKTASMPSPPPVSSSSSSKGQSMKSPSHSMTSSPVRGSTKALSFMSGMSQTKRRRSPSGKLLSSSGSSSYSEAPIIEKRIDDRKRFGSLTLVPLVSLRSGSSPNRLYSDDSSSSSDSSDSEIDTRKRVQSPSKSPSRVAISAKQVRLTLGGRLRKMSDVIAESVRATVRTEEVTSPLEEAAGNCAASAEVTATIIAQSAPSSSSKSKGLQLSNMDVNYTASAEDTDLPSDTLEPISLDSPVVGMSDTLEPISLDSPVVGIIPSQASGTDEEHPPQKRVRAPSKAKGGTKARKITKIDQTRQQTNSEENGIEPVIAAVVVDTLASNSSSGPRSVAVVSTEWLPEEMIALYASQAQTEVTAPNFWDLVAEEMANRAVLRTAEECQTKWFQSLDNADKRRQKKLQAPSKAIKDKNAAQASSSSSVSAPKDDTVVTENGDADADTDIALVTQKKKRLKRSDIKHLAEEASKASKADNIFDYQSQQNTRIYDTLGGQKEVPTSSSSASSGQHVSISESYQHILMHSAIEVTSIPLPSEGSKVPDSLEDILTLQSPTADKVTEDTSGVVTRTGIRANNATYIHALSKKMSSKFGKKSNNNALQPSTVKGTESSHSEIGNPISERLLSLEILKKSGPRSGRVLMQIPAMKPSDAVEDDDNDAASDSDEYNQNLSEEEDGDF